MASKCLSDPSLQMLKIIRIQNIKSAVLCNSFMIKIFYNVKIILFQVCLVNILYNAKIKIFLSMVSLQAVTVVN